MAGNSFGDIFRVTTFGESHGEAVGAIVDGCPPGLLLSQADIQKELDRRIPGQSSITTPRKESDMIRILSGVFEGVTTGTPIMLMVKNSDMRPEDYISLKDVYRPGHADYTYEAKYGIRDWRGSGRASARETLGRVAAGAIAQKFLKIKARIEFLSFVEQVGDIRANIDVKGLTRKDIDDNEIRCPHKSKAKEMIKLINRIKKEGDTVGGIIKGIIGGVPAGLGEPVFDKLPALLGHAMLSINAVKGFEIGSGFTGASMKGSGHNDEFMADGKGKIRTRTNYAGGVLGGISNGETINFRVAFKPVSTIGKLQGTVNTKKKNVTFTASGRHDPCVLPRAVPVVDAMAAIVIMDLYLRQKTVKI